MVLVILLASFYLTGGNLIKVFNFISNYNINFFVCYSASGCPLANKNKGNGDSVESSPNSSSNLSSNNKYGTNTSTTAAGSFGSRLSYSDHMPLDNTAAVGIHHIDSSDNLKPRKKFKSDSDPNIQDEKARQWSKFGFYGMLTNNIFHFFAGEH